MEPLDVIEVNGRRIELHQGDLANLDPSDAFDLLVVSAFPDNYVPSPTSLIGSLWNSGVSVHELADDKDVDLRETCGCWLSKQFDDRPPGIQFGRILCFEPLVRGSPPDVVGDIFRALFPFVGETVDPPVRTVAMPVVAAGNQRHSIETMLKPLVHAAIHWLGIGLPLDTLKIFTFSDAETEEARPLFAQLKAEIAPQSQAMVDGPSFDVMVSYARKDGGPAARGVADHLSADGYRVFVDTEEIAPGSDWIERVFTAVADCSRMVPIYSPAYVASRICQHEFNTALALSFGKKPPNFIYPIYWKETPALLPQMAPLSWADCREEDVAALPDACQTLAADLSR